MTTQQTTDSTTDKPRNQGFPVSTFRWVAFFILAAAFGAYLILLGLPTWLQGNNQTIVVLLVAGLVSVTLLLYFGTIVMRTAGLSTKKEALGMPEGSIRALIAVSLILMFAIIGVTVLFSGMGGEPIQSNGITAAEVERLENVQIIAISAVDPAASPGTERFNVTAVPELSEASHDFGLQLLTTVSTLVVAVAGFYFGSRAVAQGAKNANDAQAAAATARAARAGEAAGVGGAVAATTAADGAAVTPLEDEELVGAVEEVNDADGGGDLIVVEEEGEGDLVVEIDTGADAAPAADEKEGDAPPKADETKPDKP